MLRVGDLADFASGDPAPLCKDGCCLAGWDRWSSEGPAFFHYRDRDGSEVDLVLEFGSHAVVGIEVKAGATVTAGEFGGLRKLRAAAGRRFRAGVVLYDGEGSVPFGEGLFAVPIRALWDGT